MNDSDRESMGTMASTGTVVRLPTSPLSPGEREAARWLIRQALRAWREQQRQAA